MTRTLLAGFLLAAAGTAAPAGNWPNWRGPGNQGRADETDLPLNWDAKTNVRWRVPLPDAGNSTPVVWGKRVFLTQAKDKTTWPPKNNAGPAVAESRTLMCFDRADGKLLWERAVAYKEPESTHGTNPFCSASPATDGERVYVSHGSAGLYCYDFDGKEIWKYDPGKLEHIWGNASSPILHDNLCILWAGPGTVQKLVALDKRTGRPAWEFDEPGGASGAGDSKEWRGSWCTPVVAKVGGREELILGVPEKVKAFDPKTGKELWWCAGLGKLVYTSPLVSDDGVVVAMAGYGGPALAVRAGGSGDVTATHRLWHHDKPNPQRVGSGVLVGGHVYIVNDTGTAQCFEAATGKEIWGAPRVAPTWSSMVAAGDRLYITAKNGDTHVLKAGPKFESLAKNRIGEDLYSSVAASDGELFIRTFKALWCISAKR
jgi:outer membrane protein assembly factor BamB